jgi:nucleoside-diphosphate-sugar epimerase
MEVVVTGGAGFIGSHLVAGLAELDNSVVAIDRRDRDLLGTPLLVADLAKTDLDAAAADVLRSAEVVFHLAASPGVRTTGPEVARRRHFDNVVAGRNVVRLVRPSAHLIVTSSSSVYGGARRSQGSVRACRETDPLRPIGGYARSKVGLERICDRRIATGGMTTIVRPFTVAGPRQRPDMALARWIEDVQAGRPITVLGAPDRTRDVTDVDDVVGGLIAIAGSPATGTFNLGSGRGRTLGEMAAAVFAAVGRTVPIHVKPASRQEVTDTLADLTRARAALGYAPNTDLNGIVRREVELAPAGATR